MLMILKLEIGFIFFDLSKKRLPMKSFYANVLIELNKLFLELNDLALVRKT